MVPRDALNYSEGQKRFVSVTKKFASDALNDFADLQARVAALSRRESELLTNASAALEQMERCTEELCQARETILRHSRQLVDTAQLEELITDLKETVAFRKDSYGSFKDELTMAMAENTQAGALWDSARPQVVEF